MRQISQVSTVTVVIPVYNPGGHLARALSSVVRQTSSDWECLVVDDGGDEVLDWVDTYHPRVRRHRQANAGVSIARNVGLLHAKSPFIAYLDQDDEWLPEKLARQLSVIGDGDLSYTDFVWVRPDGTESVNGAPQIDYLQFLREGHLCLSSLIVRRTALVRVGGFNQLLRVQQDYDLVLRLLAARARAVPVPDVLTRCHLHQGNVSSDYRRALSERLAVLGLHEIGAARGLDPGVAGAAKQGRCVVRHLYATQAFTAFRVERAPIHLARAVMWSPRATLTDVIVALRHKLGRPPRPPHTLARP